ncbi:hypothetical protein [Kroppenstedtia pulmonis]|nr:hypothetical protein [Kroppenstedtia pulmonis]
MTLTGIVWITEVELIYKGQEEGMRQLAGMEKKFNCTMLREKSLGQWLKC